MAGRTSPIMANSGGEVPCQTGPNGARQATTAVTSRIEVHREEAGRKSTALAKKSREGSPR